MKVHRVREEGDEIDPEHTAIDEDMVREEERREGEVPPSSPEEVAEFKSTMYAYYDCEAYQAEDGLQLCNLVVVQWEKGGLQDKVFRGDTARDDFCKGALTKEHKGWTFLAHNAKR